MMFARALIQNHGAKAAKTTTVTAVDSKKAKVKALLQFASSIRTSPHKPFLSTHRAQFPRSILQPSAPQFPHPPHQRLTSPSPRTIGQPPHKILLVHANTPTIAANIPRLIYAAGSTLNPDGSPPGRAAPRRAASDLPSAATPGFHEATPGFHAATPGFMGRP